MNSTVRKDVIDSLGGIQDTLKPLEKSLREHEMRPFDVEPNYYEELMLSRTGGGLKKLSGAESTTNLRQVDSTSNMVPTTSEFLKRTMTDRNFASSRGEIVSASPFRAIIRRND